MTLIDWLSDPRFAWASFITLSAMEIVLGIDNVVFISLMVSAHSAPSSGYGASRVGLSLALIFRIIMLGGIAYVGPSDDACVQRGGLRLLLARPDPDRRRAVPSRQGHARDASRHLKARRRRTKTAPAPASSTR